MILLIGGEKGGTGKTTLAVHLAAMRAGQGRETILVDTDRQGSASAWCAVRGEHGKVPPLVCIQKFGKGLGADIRALAGKYAEVIIDAGGRDSVELRAAMTIADRLFIPIQASQFDVWTLDAMNELVGQVQGINAGLSAAAVLNRASTNPNVREIDEARGALADYENLGIAGSVLRDRIAFRKAARDGLTVAELPDRDPRAVSEMTSLYREIYDGRSA